MQYNAACMHVHDTHLGHEKDIGWIHAAMERCFGRIKEDWDCRSECKCTFLRMCVYVCESGEAHGFGYVCICMYVCEYACL